MHMTANKLDLRHEIERLMFRQLVEDGGRDTVTTKPLEGLSFGIDRPRDYRQSVAMLRRIAAVSTALLSDHARKARGDGLSWDDIAPAVLGHEAEEYDDPAVETFRRVAPRPSIRFDDVIASWTCASCGQWIRDTGPYGDSPADAEQGHADNCTRHAADQAGWHRRAGWDDPEN